MSSGARWALMHELRGAPELTLRRGDRPAVPVRLVLVEGYKRAAIPKLEIWREMLGKPLLHPSIRISWLSRPTHRATADPIAGVSLNDAGTIATFIAGQGAAWPLSD